MSLYDIVIEDVTDLGYDFRINDLDESLEVFFDNKWQRINSNHEAIIRLQMRMLGYGNKDLKPANLSAMEECFTLRGHKQRYNPILGYFESLSYEPETIDLAITPYRSAMLADHLDNPDGMFEHFFFRWIVGAVAKVYEGARNPMLIMTGKQNIGKSWLAEWLNPLDNRFFRGAIRPDNKDDKFKMTGVLVWEVDEFGHVSRRADFESLKSFLTLSEIFDRPPYGGHPIRKRANSSFIGTVNPTGAGFLNDPTGSTRFLVTEINHINFDYAKNIKVDDLWAEAVWFYKNVPGSWKLTPEENDARRRINSQYENTSALQDLAESLFEFTGQETDTMTTQDVKTLVIAENYRINNENSFYNELARVMTKLGAKKGRLPHSQGGRRCYVGVKIREIDTTDLNDY
jgi:predicted P-loop ATPase